MLDRIDIHIEVPRVDYEKLSDDRLGKLKSRNHLQRRYASRSSPVVLSVRQNWQRPDAAQTKVCGPHELDARCSSAALSARAYHQVLKLVRTIADLAGEEKIAPTHLAEQQQYCP